jgi:hypothetical protein
MINRTRTSASKNGKQEVLLHPSFLETPSHFLQYNMQSLNGETIFNIQNVLQISKAYILIFISIVDGKVY